MTKKARSLHAETKKNKKKKEFNDGNGGEEEEKGKLQDKRRSYMWTLISLHEITHKQ